MLYRTIMADPPWPYRSGGEGPLAPGRSVLAGASAAKRYSLMPLIRIKSLPVRKYAEEDAHLYLWTTNAFLVEAHDVARAWGFNPITMITWVKTKKSGELAPSMKIGFYFRGATEHCLFCVRGSLRLKTREGVSTAFFHEREKHSKKPSAFYKLVERCSPGPYLELFARRPRVGWASWGNEVKPSFDLEGSDGLRSMDEVESASEPGVGAALSSSHVD